MKLSRYRDALEVATECVQLDPDYYVAHLFKSVCEVELNDFVSAAVTFQIILDNDAKNELHKELFDILDSEYVYVAKFSSHNRNKNFIAALQTADEALLRNPRKLYSLLKAAALVQLKNFAEANHYTSFIHDIRKNFNSESLVYRALCHYYLGNVEKAMIYFLVAQLISPVSHRYIVLCDHSTEITLMKESAKASINLQFHRTAYELYSAALVVDPLNAWGNAKLYFNRSIVAVKAGNKLNAISDCTSAIQLNNFYLKAYLRRAKLYSDLNMFQKSLDDYTRVCDITYCD
ncbi:dnaJ subfamily C member 7-like protein, partial [Leptotrombidium deliense]